MIYKLSEVAKTKHQFEKWVDAKKIEVEKIIYEKRNEIYKREVNNQLADFETLKNAWDGLMKLRKKSTDYDIDIKIDNKGYTDFYVRFPIEQEHLYKMIEDRNTYCKENDIPKCCVYLQEWLWKYLKDQLKETFNFVDWCDASYCVEDTCYNFVKKVFVVRFK